MEKGQCWSAVMADEGCEAARVMGGGRGEAVEGDVAVLQYVVTTSVLN